MKKTTLYLLLSLTTAIITSCGTYNRKADLTGIDFDVTIERFDSAFWTMDTTNLEGEFHKLKTNFPEITETYLQQVIRFGHPDSAITHDTYKIFRNDTSVQRLYTDALNKFSDMSEYNKQLTSAFRKAKYFLPHLSTPKVYCHVSGLNQSIIIGNNFISLSIDNYMGSDYEIYSLLNIYEYQRKNMKPEKVVCDYITAWLVGEYPKNVSENLLNDIVYQGKILYTASQLLELPDSLLMGYTSAEWEWVNKYEKDMWLSLMASKDLYTTQLIEKGRYVNDGPFTLPFTQESPGRAGVFIGWQIVKSYMKHNSNISIQQLMQETDAQKILNQSRYNP